MDENSIDSRPVPIGEADPPAGHIRRPEGPPPVDFDHTRAWLKELIGAANQIGSAALTPEQLAEIDTHLAFAAWNQPRFESAIGILEAIIEAVSGSAAAQSPLTFIDLTKVLDRTLAELSGQVVLSVAGLNRMLPGPLSPAEVDQLREQFPHSSVRDAVRETVFANTEARREVLTAAMPSLAPPHSLAGVLSQWASLAAAPADTISSALSALSEFCGLRIVRFRDLDTTFLAFQDPDTGRCYEVGHGLSRWLFGQKKSPGSPTGWVGEPLHELRPGDFIETSPHDYARHDTAETAGA